MLQEYRLIFLLFAHATKVKKTTGTLVKSKNWNSLIHLFKQENVWLEKDLSEFNFSLIEQNGYALISNISFYNQDT